MPSKRKHLVFISHSSVGKKRKHFDFFISYSHQDREWARKFARALKDRNASVWFAEDEIAPGDQFTEAMNEGLRSSKTVAIVLSGKSSEMPQLLFEMGAAIGMGKRVVPIVPTGLDPADFPIPLRLRRFLLRGKPEETAAELLAEPAITA